MIEQGLIYIIILFLFKFKTKYCNLAAFCASINCLILYTKLLFHNSHVFMVVLWAILALVMKNIVPILCKNILEMYYFATPRSEATGLILRSGEIVYATMEYMKNGSNRRLLPSAMPRAVIFLCFWAFCTFTPLWHNKLFFLHSIL